MKTIAILTTRNIKLYMRDRTSIFFSMLTILIIIVLNMVFLEKMNVDSLINLVSTNRAAATYLVSSLTLSGIIFTSTLTVTLNVIGIMIEDEQNKRMMAFLVAPISRLKLTLGYILASFITGCILSLITLAISQAYILAIGGNLLSLQTLIKLVGIIIVNVFSNACMLFFFTTFVRSLSSFSILSTITGTLIGFIVGIYLPIGMLPEIVQKCMKCFPGLYGVSMIRELFSNDALSQVFKTAPLVILKEYKKYMGVTLSWGNAEVTPWVSLLILIGSGILFIILSTFVLNSRKGSDR